MSTETTTPTTAPPPPDVAFVDEVAVREGTPVPVELPEGYCFVPADRWQEFLLTYVPCEDLQATVAVAEPPVPVMQTLPETGAALDIAFIAGILIAIGGILLRVRDRGSNGH